MAKLVKAAKKSEIPEGTGKALTFEGIEIALFNVGGNFYAIENICKHQGGPLGEGELDGKEVICPWHGWQYDVTTGACSTQPGVTQQKYAVKIEGDDILIEI